MTNSNVVAEKLDLILGCHPYDCPIRQVLDGLGGKWAVLVLMSLSRGPRRFGEIKAGIPDVSQKMLTQVLRAFERDGLITRRDEGGFPRVVFYNLTALGEDLLGPLDVMTTWANANMAEILNNRERYDRNTRD
jgi:DNA-binding HxlR family transcriptional regulator